MRLQKTLSILLTVCMILSSVSLAYAEVIPDEVMEETVQHETAAAEADEAQTSEPVDVESESGESDMTDGSDTQTAAEDTREYNTGTVSEAQDKKSENIVLTAALEDVKVTLTASADAFENNGELSLSVAAAEAAEAERAGEALDAVEKENVAKRVTYDVSVLDDGEEIEPVKEVKVEFVFSDAPSGADGVNIYHHDAEKGIERIATEALKKDNKNVSADTVAAQMQASAGKSAESAEITDEELAATDDVEIINDITVEASVDSFSLYTVDFTYKDKTVSIGGDSTGNKLGDVLAQLGIEEKIEEAVTYQDSSCDGENTDGEVRNEAGDVLFTVYENADIWYVDAVNAFDTEHGLVVKTSDGAEYKIKVTDSNNTMRVTYTDEQGIQKTVDAKPLLDGYHNDNIEWYENICASSMFSLDGVLTVSGGCCVNGEVNLILETGATLVINAEDAYYESITHAEGGKLKIYSESGGTGTVILNGSNYYGCSTAGINCDTTIVGCNVIANGGNNGAGITGNITVISGNVTANGGTNASGISGNLTVNGGTVRATGGVNAPGISGNVTINGGTVYAAGGANCAGISGNVTINAGTVDVLAGDGAASAISAGGSGSAGSIIISKGNIAVNADDGKIITCGGTADVSSAFIGIRHIEISPALRLFSGYSGSSEMGAARKKQIRGANAAVTPITVATDGTQVMGSSIISKPESMLTIEEVAGIYDKDSGAEWSVNEQTGTYNLKDGTGAIVKNKIVAVSDDISSSGVGNVSYYGFDENGDMLYGWNWVADVNGDYSAYFFNNEEGSLFGSCLLGGEKNGKELSASGQAMANGIAAIVKNKKPVTVGGSSGYTWRGGEDSWELLDGSGKPCTDEIIAVVDDLYKEGELKLANYGFDGDGKMMTGWNLANAGDGTSILTYFSKVDGKQMMSSIKQKIQDGVKLDENGVAVIKGMMQKFDGKPGDIPEEVKQKLKDLVKASAQNAG